MKYRIVRDNYLGYEVQRRWFLIFWSQLGGINTFSTIESARWYAQNHKDIVEKGNV